MPARLHEETRQNIFALREGGASLNAICEALDVPKSTVQYVLEGFRPSAAGLGRIRRMRAVARAANTVKLQAARKASLQHYRHDEHREAAVQRAREVSLRYRAEEFPIRAKLQARYGEDLCKEAFDGCVIKACGADVVIDWTLTKTATQKLPARMSVVKSMSDKRRRIAYIPRKYLKSKAAERLRKLWVKVEAVEDLLD